MKITHETNRGIINLETNDPGTIEKVLELFTIHPVGEYKQQKAKVKKSHKVWTGVEDGMLQSAFLEGKNLRSMAILLGRTKHSCKSRLYTLKLLGKNGSMQASLLPEDEVADEWSNPDVCCHGNHQGMDTRYTDDGYEEVVCNISGLILRRQKLKSGGTV